MEMLELRESAVIEKLPTDIVEAIAKYLSTKDILACCATSCSMRDNFSDDAIWRPRCNSDLAGFLEKGKEESIFDNLQIAQDSSLNPLPKWRTHFIYENHLWNCWCQEKPNKEGVTFREPTYPYFETLHIFQRSDSFTADFSGEDLFGFVKLPGYETMETPFYEHFVRNTKINTTQYYRLFYLAGPCVQLLDLDLDARKCVTKRSFCFEDSSQMEKNRTVQSGNLFISNSMIMVLLDEGLLHIWNLDTGLKVIQ